MGSWRDRILTEFAPGVARLTLVADPDGLLLEEGILEGIRERKFELIPFEDHIVFRYAYESKFRSRWDRGDTMDLVVVLHSQESDLGILPYDILQAGRKLSFNLGDIFPKLSYSVLTKIDPADLDVLYEAQEVYAPDRMGDNATRDFILRHVFDIAFEQIKQPSDLLRVLIRQHHRGQRIPSLIVERYIRILRQSSHFDDWPLERLIKDREAFFRFLQERWPFFLDREAAKGASGVLEAGKPYGLSIEGPIDLPFDHNEIRAFINDLFMEGYLHSVPHAHADSLASTWVRIGVQTPSIHDGPHRLAKLMEKLNSNIPPEGAKHTDWFHFSRGWAEATLLANQQNEPLPGPLSEHFEHVQTRVDEQFFEWLCRRYAGLFSLPPAPPVMVHHLPRFLARQMEELNNTKIALILVDGLSMDQWLVIRSILSSQHPGLNFQERAIFAWIPSLTSVSRQAAFSGKLPMYFPDSIRITDREPVFWSQFWCDQGIDANGIVYLRGLGDGGLEPVSEALSHPRVRVAGLVVDKVDRIMHGMELGSTGMHNQIGQWAGQRYLLNLLDLVLDRGFQVYLTSDHGNIEAEGIGRPTEGMVADIRGERVRVYTDPILRSSVKARFPTAVEWDPIGLPEQYFPLLAPGRTAFIRQKQRTVSHGGISIEELIVPFVKIERKEL